MILCPGFLFYFYSCVPTVSCGPPSVAVANRQLVSRDCVVLLLLLRHRSALRILVFHPLQSVLFSCDRPPRPFCLALCAWCPVVSCVGEIIPPPFLFCEVGVVCFFSFSSAARGWHLRSVSRRWPLFVRRSTVSPQ